MNYTEDIKMKKKAFTIAEILVALVVVGIIVKSVVSNVQSDTFQEKANIARAYKVINEFDKASASIIATDSINCPLGALMQKAGKNEDGSYDYELGLVLPDNNKEKAVLDIYGEHMKFEKTDLNFCDYSTYCQIANNGTTNIPAVRFANTIYAGIKLYNEVQNCPDFSLPETEGKITPHTKMSGETPKCWANLYVDVNGMEEPNIEGKDIFIFGLDEFGIHR